MAILLCLCPAATMAESHLPLPEGLRGVRMVDVVTVSRCGYNEASNTLKGMVPEIQKQLVDHGIGIASGYRPFTAASATLVIDVSCSRIGMEGGRPVIWLGPEATGILDTGRLIYHARISLERPVRLLDTSIPQILAQTWSYDRELEVAQGPKLAKLRSTVKLLVDYFISCYESVNTLPSEKRPG
jgi:hypothetical protein